MYVSIEFDVQKFESTNLEMFLTIGRYIKNVENIGDIPVSQSLY